MSDEALLSVEMVPESSTESEVRQTGRAWTGGFFCRGSSGGLVNNTCRRNECISWVTTKIEFSGS